MSDRGLGIYLHVPYCRTLCPYCDFVKARSKTGVPDAFIAAICEEITRFEGPNSATSIFFGGGTPSLLSEGQLETILTSLHRRFSISDCEITLEINPDDVTHELAKSWRSVGANRISLGVQSFDDKVLRYLGRRHGATRAIEACNIIREHFENWNMDLIFGAPPQEAWEKTLKQCIALAPPHVATYGLTYEPGTPFERRINEAIDDELALQQYQQAEKALERLAHYEVSNFALAGWESEHNLLYWHNRPYAGFGPGAYCYLDGVRARNHPVIDDYLRAPGEKVEALSLSTREQQVETLIQHFRLRDGLPIERYVKRFSVNPRVDFAHALDQLIARGLVLETASHLRPTPQGFYLNNEIGLALVES